MFLMYAAPGAIVPILSLRLHALGFSHAAIAWCCATQALGSLVAPLLAGQVADRWFPAEKLVAAYSFLSALLLWLLAGLTTPSAVFGVSLVLWLVMAPTFTLGTAICFTHLGDARRQFGRVRMWGTVGWVIPGWVMGFLLAGSETIAPVMNALRPLRPALDFADSFRLAAVCAAVFGLYALSLPHTPPRRSLGGAAPLVALRMLRDRAFFVYAFCTFGIAAALPFSSQVSPLLLESLGVGKPWIPRLLTIAQTSEIVSLVLLPRIINGFGVRRTMQLGLLALTATLASLMIGRPLGLVLAGLGCYGLCISCYLVAGQMYLNQRTRRDVRASAQSLHSVLCGLGLLVGNLLVGQVRTWVDGAFAPTFAVGTAMILALVVLFTAAFPRAERE